MVACDLFEVMNYVVIFNSEGKVLMVRAVDSNPRISGKWGFPGGHLEYGEKVEEAVRREVLEETDVEIENIRAVFVDVIEKTCSIIFRADFVSGNLKLSGEHSEAKWVGLSEVEKLDLIDRVLVDYIKKAKG